MIRCFTKQSYLKSVGECRVPEDVSKSDSQNLFKESTLSITQCINVSQRCFAVFFVVNLSPDQS